MADENLVTVKNNKNPAIELEIMTYTNENDIEITQSNEAALSVHNSDENAHPVIIDSINDDLEEICNNITQINTYLAAKANASTTYTKTESDALLGTKLNTSDTTVTRQGNTFNGNSQLVQTTSTGQLPALNGSLLTALPSTVANTSLSNLTTTGKTVVSNLAMPSSSYIDLTLGSSGSTYTAPADGYLFLNKISGNAGERVKLYNLPTQRGLGTWSVATGEALDSLLSVQKNEVITYLYTASGTTNYFRFFYAEGSKP